MGLSGYDAGPSWSITTKANVDPATVEFLCTSAETFSCVTTCLDYEVIDYSFDFTGCTNSTDSIVFDESTIESLIKDKLDQEYELFNGSTSTLRDDFKNQVFDVITSSDYNDAANNSVYYYGIISGETYQTFTGYTAQTNVFGVDDVNSLTANYSDSNNDPWYYALFDNVGSGNYTGFSFYSVINLNLIPPTTTTTSTSTTTTTTTDPCNPVSTTTTSTTTIQPVFCYEGTISGQIFVYEGKAYTDYDDLVVATLRSRGIATYTQDDGAVYEVTGSTSVTMNCSNGYSSVIKNPYATFGLNVTNKDGENLFFETSLTNSDSQYITKVFGRTNFEKPRDTNPLFVEEVYQSLLNYGWRKGYIRGLSCSVTYLPESRNGDPSSIGWYLEQYQSSTSPWVVSELRGNKVFRLFKFTTISDGNNSNYEVKLSIANISFNNLTFDVLVRDYYDTDSNPVVLEKFTNCSMDPSDNSYIAKKIGTLDGEFQLNSKYIMLEVNLDAPVDSLPCGFEGYRSREYSGVKPPFPIYKTKYDFPGEVVYNPPFGTSTGADDALISSGDNVRRTYLGLSDTIGYDFDFFAYKGKQTPLNVCFDTTGDDWSYVTKGFHMDKNASGITIGNGLSTSGTPAFFVGSAEFTSDPDNESNPYYKIFARKFSLMCQGGFDGWDIYREYRTNGDRFRLGQTFYKNGACPNIKYPTATGWGAFKQISVGDNTIDWANTDYYAYLLGIRTFANPEAVNVNLFVTPGIDYINNQNLVISTIDMIENDRADSLYITTTPDYNLLVPQTGNQNDIIFPQDAVDSLDNTGIDSNYTCTYYPWVLTRDSVNNTQIYIPATAEVTRNLALTDNIAFPWFAAAGYTRGIVNAIKARKKLTQEDRDILYQADLMAARIEFEREWLPKFKNSVSPLKRILH